MRTSLVTMALIALAAAGCGGESSAGGGGGHDLGTSDGSAGSGGAADMGGMGGGGTGGAMDAHVTPPDMGPQADAAADAGTGADAAPADAAPADAGADAAPDAAVEDTLCQACESDDDCHPAGAKCLQAADGSKFCGQDCANDDCPDGYDCAAQDDGGHQCVPSFGHCGECQDADHDGYGVGPGCLGPDCNDAEPRAHTGAADVCDGVDNNCDGQTDEDYQPQSCGVGACAATSSCVGGVEMPCVPGNPAPSDTTCNGVDDNCNGQADEGYVPEHCGDGVCAATSSCTAGVETPCMPGMPQAQRDDTCDQIDEDCDGLVDDDYVGPTCGVGACAQTSVCTDGNVSCQASQPLSADDATCNNVDDNCNGEVDEDFHTDEHCGLGVCRRDAVCTDGQISCTAGDPLSADDATCDGVDDNCNGHVDEDCNQNFLGFQEVTRDAGHIVVDVSFTRQASPEGDDNQGKPRLISLLINHPEGLTMICDDGTTDYPCFAPIINAANPTDVGVEFGSSVIAAQKVDESIAQAMSPTQVRVVILSSANTNRIDPGQIVRIHFGRAGGAHGPFDLTWDRDGTDFAPEDANNALTVQPGQLPD